MSRFYVDISGIPQSYLDFLGYLVIFEDDEFKILLQKSDLHLVDKAKPYLFVEDENDADLLGGRFRERRRIPLPPSGTD